MKKLMLIIVLLFSFVGFSQNSKIEDTPKRVTLTISIPKEPGKDFLSMLKNTTPEIRKKDICNNASLHREFLWNEYAYKEPMKAGALLTLKLNKLPIDVVCTVTEKKLSNTKYLYQFRPNPELYDTNRQSEEFRSTMKGLSKFDILASYSPSTLEVQIFDFNGNSKNNEPSVISKADLIKGTTVMSLRKKMLPNVSIEFKERALKRMEQEKLQNSLREQQKDTITE